MGENKGVEKQHRIHNGRCLLVMFATSLLPARNKNARCLYCGVILCISARTLRLIDLCVWLEDHAIEISVIDCMFPTGAIVALSVGVSV